MNGPLSGTVDKITYTYDELGRRTGRTLNTTAESITLDALVRATAATNALDSFVTGYVNATARPQTVTFPNNQTTTYTYYPNTAPAGTGNGDQRLQTIWHKDAAAATISKHDYSYDPAGEITGWTQQAGATPASAYGYEYDRASQLLAATKRDAATNAVQKQYTYRYDLAGNRTLEQIDSSVSSATYNNVNQLTARTGAGPMVFEGTVNKDATGTVGGIAATVNGQNRFSAQVYVQPGQQSIEITARDAQGRTTAGHAQMTVEAGAIIPLVSYDLNGNQTADGARIYDWDAANRLVKITQGANVREFAYNGFGQRMSEKVNGTLTRRWLWDGAEMLAELDASNAVTKRFFAQGEQIAGASYYYTRDHLGSIREVTDSTNTLRARYDYDPWGRRSANLVTTNPVESDFGYTGHYYDAATGMRVTLYRWLDGARWLNRDPIGEDGGMNLYGYVLNNPIIGIDPLGLDVVVSPRDQANYNAARNYLMGDPTMSKIINDLEQSKTKFFLKCNRKDDDQSRRGLLGQRVIRWDPYSALRTTGGGRQTPAMGLGHEMDHAHGDFFNPSQFNRDVRTPDAAYDTAEERRVIQGSETNACRSLGENSRFDHSGNAYKVLSPILR